MAAAFFALAGALIGVAGTLLTTLVGARQQERRTRTDTLRQACTEFLKEVGRLRDLSHALHAEPAGAREDLTTVREVPGGSLASLFRRVT